MRLDQINQVSLLRRALLGFLLATVSQSGFAQESMETEAAAMSTDAGNAQGSQKPASPAAGFDLLELRVKGNTLLPRQAIEKVVYPYLGKNKSIDTVEQARTALEQLYFGKGYQTIAVDIPEQDVVGGVVYLQVTEGKVARLRVTDSRYFSLGSIKAKVPALAEGGVPNLPKMQEQLAELAKESPDRKITPILRAGETPGTLEVDLKVQDELPLHGKFEINGRNTANTGRLRAIASVRYDNLWQKFHSASFMYQTSPELPEEVEVVVGTYALPVFESDKRLAFYAVSSSSTSQVASAGALSVVGTGNIYGMRYVNPLSGSDSYFHTFTAGIDYKDFKEDLALLGADTLKTPISYAPFTLGYTGNLRGEASLLSVNVNANFSVRGLGNTEQQFADKRFNAKSNYIYLGTEVDYRHDLPWGMEFDGHFSGQIANSPLISNEQFSIGGSDSVRGYYETQVLADDGLQGALELFTPRLIPDAWEEFNKLRGLIFVDAGRGWIQDALKGNANHFNLLSAGAGVRMQIWKALLANFDVAVPFIKQGTVESGEPRVHFQVTAEF